MQLMQKKMWLFPLRVLDHNLASLAAGLVNADGGNAEDPTSSHSGVCDQRLWLSPDFLVGIYILPVCRRAGVDNRDHTNLQTTAILHIEPRREFEEQSGWAALGTE